MATPSSSRSARRAPAPAVAARSGNGAASPAAATRPALNGSQGANGHAEPATAAAGHRVETLEECLLRSLAQYFDDLGGAQPHKLHDMVMQAVERPLLRFALERAAGNQSAAADLLGINRNTLRKKLVEHGLV